VFYAVLTTENKLNIYSTRSTQLIKAGLILDSVCMLVSNGEASLMCTITLKGVVSLFRVKDVQSLDSCVQIWTSSLVDVLKLRSALFLQKKQASVFGEKLQDKVFVDSLIVTGDGTVIVFLSDKSQFEYAEKARVWREITSAFEGEDLVSDCYPVTTSGGQNILRAVESKQESKEDSLSSLISKLEHQNLNSTEAQEINALTLSTASLKVTELQEMLELYEKL
jgi:hypothetical protein